MEENFDKQIDAVLRDLVERNSLVEVLPESHPDADELSLFAENVSPAASRRRTMEHLADCRKCRVILTNLITLNNDVESERIHEKSEKIFPIIRIPWYRQLFAFPQIAYTMGVLVLVLGGMAGYLVLQNSQDYQSTIAKQDEDSFPKPVSGNGPAQNVGTNSPYPENTYNSSSANTTSNTVGPNVGSSANRSTPMSPGDLSDKVARTETTPNSELIVAAPPDVGPEVVGKTKRSDLDLKTGKDNVVPKEETPGKNRGEVPASQVSNETKASDIGDNNVARQQVLDLPVQGRNQSNVIMPDGANQSQRNLPAPVDRNSQVRRDQDESGAGSSAERERSQKKMSEKPATTIGEKTFRSVNGVWIDSLYSGGNTTIVKRGTEGYKKLDSELQKIGNALSGPVIVVWKGKSFKIQ